MRLHELFKAERSADVDVVRGRRLVLGNGDVRLSYVVAGRTSPLYRNGIGDECLYVERGQARVETIFGSFEVGQGDYVVIPRATTHRWIPRRGRAAARLLHRGELAHHAAEALPVAVRPAPRALAVLRARPARTRRTVARRRLGLGRGADTEVYIKHRGNGPSGVVGTIYTYPFHPFDVVGWDGCLYPYVFNVSDFEPITGRVHQPPPVHQVFEGYNFVVCNFVPRKVDYHPLSIPVPYYHSNVDSDEIMFYVDGDYEARKGSGIAKGSITVHPGGHAHGPQTGAYEKLHRRGLLRRARGHGRHLPATRARRGGPGVRRRRVRLVVGEGCCRRRRTPVPRLTASRAVRSSSELTAMKRSVENRASFRSSTEDSERSPTGIVSASSRESRWKVDVMEAR